MCTFLYQLKPIWADIQGRFFKPGHAHVCISNDNVLPPHRGKVLRPPGFRGARNSGRIFLVNFHLVRRYYFNESFLHHTMRSIHMCTRCTAFSELMLLLCLFVHVNCLFSSSRIRYQPGQKRHGLRIATTLAKQWMNPLDIQTDRFIVATTTTDDLIGWAQIKSMGSLMMQDPARFDSRPGSYNVQRDVDDALWDEFEQDSSIQVPTGLASLPLTKEYQQMQVAARNREKRRERIRETEQKLKQLQLYELSSVYVDPAYRNQGIGKELVRRVLRRRLIEANSPSLPTSVYLLTLRTTSSWYQQYFGFEIVDADNIPTSMTFEVTVGNMITSLLGAELCCMRGTSKTVDLCKS